MEQDERERSASPAWDLSTSLLRDSRLLENARLLYGTAAHKDAAEVRRELRVLAGCSSDARDVTRPGTEVPVLYKVIGSWDEDGRKQQSRAVVDGPTMRAVSRCLGLALTFAAHDGDDCAVDILVSVGADMSFCFKVDGAINGQQTLGTPLLAAIWQGKLAVVEALSAVQGWTDRDGWTALHWAAMMGQPDVCRVLVVEGGAEVDRATTPLDGGRTALLIAAFEGQTPGLFLSTSFLRRTPRAGSNRRGAPETSR